MAAAGPFILMINRGRQDRLLTRPRTSIIENMDNVNSSFSTPLLPKYGFISVPEQYYAIQRGPNCRGLEGFGRKCW